MVSVPSEYVQVTLVPQSPEAVSARQDTETIRMPSTVSRMIAFAFISPLPSFMIPCAVRSFAFAGNAALFLCPAMVFLLFVLSLPHRNGEVQSFLTLWGCKTG